MNLIESRNRKALPLLVALLMMLGVGCGSATAESGNEEPDSGPQLVDVWTRPTAPGATSTAFYATIRAEAGVEDQVISVSSDICGTAELHATSMTDGVMSMSPAAADDLVVTPQQDLVLEPGGLHIMCMGLAGPVEEGGNVPLAVEFKTGGTVIADAKVESR